MTVCSTSNPSEPSAPHHERSLKPEQRCLTVEHLGQIDRVRLNRPERLNALNQTLAEALLGYFESRRRDDAVRVILLCGAGKGFCAGLDLKAIGQPDALRDGPRGDWVLRDLVKAMRACPQPLVALVNGVAAGAGLALMLAADIIVAAEAATFRSAFIEVGLSASELGVSWRLQRAIGMSKAREMLFTGRPLNSLEAHRLGLISDRTTADALDDHGLAIARDMLRAQPDALRLSKRSFDAALESTSVETALEMEERAQMLMMSRHGLRNPFDPG
jgi:enoyl-CoA hydratase/carnithine racemase